MADTIRKNYMISKELDKALETMKIEYNLRTHEEVVRALFLLASRFNTEKERRPVQAICKKYLDKGGYPFKYTL